MPYSLSIKQASEYSGLSRTTIYKLMTTKALPTL